MKTSKTRDILLIVGGMLIGYSIKKVFDIDISANVTYRTRKATDPIFAFTMDKSNKS